MGSFDRQHAPWQFGDCAKACFAGNKEVFERFTKEIWGGTVYTEQHPRFQVAAKMAIMTQLPGIVCEINRYLNWRNAEGTTSTALVVWRDNPADDVAFLNVIYIMQMVNAATSIQRVLRGVAARRKQLAAKVAEEAARAKAAEEAVAAEAAEAELKGKLIVLKKSGADGVSFPMHYIPDAPYSEIIIGSDEDKADLQVRLPNVSPIHMRLRADEVTGDVTAENLSTTNPVGTLINGSPITEPRLLTHGDIVRAQSHAPHPSTPFLAPRLT